MGQITLRILDGIERGKVYEQLTPPVTIGREEDNTIRLNDERVSRFHAKIQEDKQRFILTDLDSTNGTRVNGHPIQTRILRPGDLILLGRSLLVYGTDEDLRKSASSSSELKERLHRAQQKRAVVAEDSVSETADVPEDLFPAGPPELPSDLNALQLAQVSDLLQYVHARILEVLYQGETQNPSEEGTALESTPHPEASPPAGTIIVQPAPWQRLIALQSNLAELLRRLHKD